MQLRFRRGICLLRGWILPVLVLGGLGLHRWMTEWGPVPDLAPTIPRAWTLPPLAAGERAFSVVLDTGGCLDRWTLSRSAVFRDGVLTLVRPVREYGPETYQSLYAIRYEGQDYLVPAWLLLPGQPGRRYIPVGMPQDRPLSATDWRIVLDMGGFSRVVEESVRQESTSPTRVNLEAWSEAETQRERSNGLSSERTEREVDLWKRSEHVPDWKRLSQGAKPLPDIDITGEWDRGGSGDHSRLSIRVLP